MTSTESKEDKTENVIPDELIQTTTNTEKSIISITTDKSLKPTEEYNDSYLSLDILGPYEKQPEEYESFSENANSNLTYAKNENNISFNQVYDVLFANKDNSTINIVESTTHQTTEQLSTTTSTVVNLTTTPKAPLKNMTNNAIPLSLITILNNSKKENPTKIEIPQRKNNKIIDPTNEPLLEGTNIPSITTEMPSSTKANAQQNENLNNLRDVFLSSLSRPTIGNSDISDELLKSPMFLTRPINKLSPSFISTASFSGLNSIESKHNFRKNPIRSELDLIITELNKNKQTNDFSHTNNFSPDNYQVLPADETNISNTESYVVNNGETKIFTPPHKDPAGLLKLAGCNIYGRMYRVGRIIAELSSSCLECRCTEVGVSCIPKC